MNKVKRLCFAVPQYLCPKICLFLFREQEKMVILFNQPVLTVHVVGSRCRRLHNWDVFDKQRYMHSLSYQAVDAFVVHPVFVVEAGYCCGDSVWEQLRLPAEQD